MTRPRQFSAHVSIRPAGHSRANDERLLRAKTARIAAKLETYLGRPRRSTPRPDPLDMLVATMLSQNTNDKNSHRAYTRLRRSFPRWEDVASAPVHLVESAIRPGGMGRQKARRIQQVLAAVVKQHGAYDLSGLRRKPTRRILEELTALKGVGVKTAACVLLFSLGRDVFPVDTHVHRLCRRLGLAGGSRLPEHTFSAMRDLVPAGRAYSFHTNLIRFGRRFCRTNHPRCDICPLYRECVYDGKAIRRGRPKGRSSTDYDFMLLEAV